MKPTTPTKAELYAEQEATSKAFLQLIGISENLIQKLSRPRSPSPAAPLPQLPAASRLSSLQLRNRNFCFSGFLIRAAISGVFPKVAVEPCGADSFDGYRAERSEKMRPTLEELKAMSPHILEAHWLDWEFPFDVANCGRCITGHHDEYAKGCHIIGHNKLRVLVSAIGPTGASRWDRWKANNIANHGQTVPQKWLIANLEELYALRLFYDSLYPQPQTIEGASCDVAHAEVCTKP